MQETDRLTNKNNSYFLSNPPGEIKEIPLTPTQQISTTISCTAQLQTIHLNTHKFTKIIPADIETKKQRSGENLEDQSIGTTNLMIFGTEIPLEIAYNIMKFLNLSDLIACRLVSKGEKFLSNAYLVHCFAGITKNLLRKETLDTYAYVKMFIILYRGISTLSQKLNKDNNELMLQNPITIAFDNTVSDWNKFLPSLDSQKHIPPIDEINKGLNKIKAVIASSDLNYVWNWFIYLCELFSEEANIIAPFVTASYEDHHISDEEKQVFGHTSLEYYPFLYDKDLLAKKTYSRCTICLLIRLNPKLVASAIELNNLPFIRLILEAKLDLNDPTFIYNSKTPYMNAVNLGYDLIIEEFCKAKVNPTKTFFPSINFHQVDMNDFVSGKFHSYTIGGTVLHHSVYQLSRMSKGICLFTHEDFEKYQRATRILEMLLKYENLCEQPNHFGVTVLMLAVDLQEINAVRILLDNHADVFKTLPIDGKYCIPNDLKGWTLLHFAVGDKNSSQPLAITPDPLIKNEEYIQLMNFNAEKLKNYVDILTLFLKYKGLNELIDKPKYDGETPLLLAVKNHNEMAVHLLLKAGANPRKTVPTQGHIKDIFKGANILHFVVYGYHNFNLRNIDPFTKEDFSHNLLNRLLEYKDLIDQPKHDSATPIMVAVMLQNQDIVKTFLDAGANPFNKIACEGDHIDDDYKGDTLLHIAVNPYREPNFFNEDFVDNNAPSIPLHHSKYKKILEKDNTQNSWERGDHNLEEELDLIKRELVFSEYKQQKEEKPIDYKENTFDFSDCETIDSSEEEREIDSEEDEVDDYLDEEVNNLNEQIRILKLLLNSGIPIDSTNLSGLTPLILAIILQNKAVVDCLLEARANPTFRVPKDGKHISHKYSGMTPLMIAKKIGNVSIIASLKKYEEEF